MACMPQVANGMQRVEEKYFWRQPNRQQPQGHHFALSALYDIG